MAENGILDYQGMNQAIYRGATSNIVVDTQSMSIEIGAGNTSHTSNLHFECNHDANVASIKLNSNVTTEFSRSKKLIKYPRVALTADAQTNSGYQGHFVSRSTQFGGYNAWEAFDNDNPHDPSAGASAGWASAGPSTETDTYDWSTGAVTSQAATHHTGAVQGEWIQIQLPDTIYLHDIKIHSRAETTYTDNMTGFPKNVYLYGKKSNDWVLVKAFTTSSRTLGDAYTEYIEYTKEAFTHFVLVVNSIHVSTNSISGQPGWTSIGQIELFGIPEYDPEAYGTDVTVKSKANVPNTDWLEVYYEGKNYTSGNVVQDETENDIDGTFTGITYNTEYNSFDFSGVSSSSKITATLPSTFVGNQPFTVSVWFKRYNDSIDENTIWRIGPRTDEKCLALAVSGGNFNFFGNDSTDGIFSSTTFNNGGYVVGRWYHVACVYDGASRYIFIDSVRDGTTVTNSLDFNASTELVLGFNGINKYLNGSIANFRLFNRAITQDEIWQLYAYQKEYFGHSDLSMTLKAGRLGIGTSEPRAALDVKGMARFKNVFFFARATTSTSFDSTNQNTLIDNVQRSNGGLALSSSGRGVTVTSTDAAGVYMVYCQVVLRTESSSEGERSQWARLRKNGTWFAQSNQAIDHISSATYTQHILSGLIDLDAGDEVTHFIDDEGTGIDVYKNGTQFYMYRIST